MISHDSSNFNKLELNSEKMKKIILIPRPLVSPCLPPLRRNPRWPGAGTSRAPVRTHRDRACVRPEQCMLLSPVWWRIRRHLGRAAIRVPSRRPALVGSLVVDARLLPAVRPCCYRSRQWTRCVVVCGALLTVAVADRHRGIRTRSLDSDGVGRRVCVERRGARH